MHFVNDKKEITSFWPPFDDGETELPMKGRSAPDT